MKNKNNNLISVKSDKDFGAIEFTLTVGDNKVGFFLSLKEAHDVSESLKGEICKMMGDDTCGGRCSDEELAKVREDHGNQTEQSEG